MKYSVLAKMEIIQIDEYEVEADTEEIALENYESGELLNSYPESWMVSELKIEKSQT